MAQALTFRAPLLTRLKRNMYIRNSARRQKTMQWIKARRSVAMRRKLILLENPLRSVDNTFILLKLRVTLNAIILQRFAVQIR